MPQFLITALGSYGDVHPMVGLGTALAARGHRVKIVTNPYFEEVVANAGLELVPIGTREDYIRLTQHPHLWRPLRGAKMVVEYISSRALRPLYDQLVANYTPAETVFCAHAMDLASRVASEKLGALVAGIFFAPGLFWSIHDSPRLKGALLGPRVPRWLKQLQFWVTDTLLVQRLLGPELNGLRRELGLSPIQRIYSRSLIAPELLLGLFPDWFGTPQPDWPAKVSLAGFPLWDSHDAAPLPGDLIEFLDTGSPPIAFSPGSANREAAQFFTAAVEACERLGRRGILLTKYADQLPRKLPSSVRHFGFVPMSKLLPRTAALVHHGGIGSCGQGLAAGVPHLVRPMSFDQFDNSRRLVRLGVAREISMRRFRGPAIANALATLLDSTSVADRCRELAAKCDGPAALADACNALEQLAESQLARYK